MRADWLFTLVDMAWLAFAAAALLLRRLLKLAAVGLMVEELSDEEGAGGGVGCRCCGGHGSVPSWSECAGGDDDSF